MSDNNLQTVKSVPSIKEFIFNNQKALKAALLEQVDINYVCRTVITQIENNPELLKCTQSSLFTSIIQALESGLCLNAKLGEAYLVPYKRGDIYICTLQFGYSGAIKLICNTGLIRNIIVEPVLKGDVFDYGLGLEPFLVHKPAKNRAEENKENLEYVYAIIDLMTGGKKFIVWSLDQIENHRKKFVKTKYQSGKPWFDNYVSMAKKTVLLADAKYLPRSAKDKTEKLFTAINNDLEPYISDQKQIASDYDINDNEAIDINEKPVNTKPHVNEPQATEEPEYDASKEMMSREKATSLIKMAENRGLTVDELWDHVSSICNATEFSEVPADKYSDISAWINKQGKQEPEKAPDPNAYIISEAQSKRLYAIAKGNGYTDDELKKYLSDNYKITSSKQIEKKNYDAICTHFSKKAGDLV